ncbi:hypothetical protein HanRHA438_Chr10g0463921 [Helianthus annuus]|nr:hypothetical protein HanRHA438_Chr10g0463921 [Helianthus annuus]
MVVNGGEVVVVMVLGCGWWLSLVGRPGWWLWCWWVGGGGGSAKVVVVVGGVN